jgi:hypothetical protein
MTSVLCALRLSSQAEGFIRQLQQAMHGELTTLGRTLLQNADVTILPKDRG